MYEQTYKLQDNEAPAKINRDTGEWTEVKKTVNNKNTIKFETNLPFARTFNMAWQLLESQTTKSELLVAHKLAVRAEAHTSSLIPLGDEMSIKDLAEYLNENRRTIMKIMDKLFSLGVIAKISINEIKHLKDLNPKIKNYWLFNPYLSFNGRAIDKTCENIFRNTYYAKMHFS